MIAFPLPAPQRAWVLIDAQLATSGRTLQGDRALQPFSGDGIAVLEAIRVPGDGRFEHLCLDRQDVGYVRTKPVVTMLSGPEWQFATDATGLLFVVEASGSETSNIYRFDPAPQAGQISAFPSPATLARMLRETDEHPDCPTSRAR